MMTSPNIPFIKFSKTFLILSGIIFSASIFLLVFKGVQTSIDFKGGTIINISITSDKHNLTLLRDTLSEQLVKAVSVVEVQSASHQKELILTTDLRFS